MANESSPSSSFLRLPQILTLVPVSKSTIWSWVKKGTFPKPCKLGPRTTAWKAVEVYEWIQSRGDVSTTVAESWLKP